jgi:hypothetical protein
MVLEPGFKLAELGTITREFVPLNRYARPEPLKPGATRVTFSSVPTFPDPEESVMVVPEVSFMCHRATVVAALDGVAVRTRRAIAAAPGMATFRIELATPSR